MKLILATIVSTLLCSSAFALPKIVNQDVAASANIVDTKIRVTANSINDTLYNAITNKLIGSGGLSATVITTDTTVAAGNLYLVNGTSLLHNTLPSSCTVGDQIGICGKSDGAASPKGSWIVSTNAAAASQTIYSGATSSASSSSNSIPVMQSLSQNSCVTILCATTNSIWNVLNSISIQIGGSAFFSGVHSQWKMNGSSSSSGELNSLQASGYDLSVVSTVPVAGALATNITTSRGPYGGANGWFKWPAAGSSTTVFDTLSFCVDFWVKYTGSGTEYYFVDKISSGSAFGWALRHRASSNNVTFDYGTGSSNVIDLGYAINDGNSHYVAFCNVGTGANQMRLWVDNVQRFSGTGVTFSPDTDDLVIGARYDGYGLPGTISTFAYWNSPGTNFTTIAQIIGERWNSGAGAYFVQ